MTHLDSLLNRITMYRLVLYVLSILALVSIVFGFTGVIGYSGLSLVGSLALLVGVTWGSEYVLTKLFNRPMNIESAYITGFILFFTLAPFTTLSDALVLGVVAFLAILSKYILAVKGKHLFNPAALALLVLSISGSGLAIWWVAAPMLLPFTVVLGFCVVRKLRREDAVYSFASAAVLLAAVNAFTQGNNAWHSLSTLILSYPLVFLGTIMLTEPQTMPPSRSLRIVYGFLVGALFVSRFHIGLVFATPQLALILGNIYSYAVSSKQKLKLHFKEMRKVSNSLTELVFESSERLAFEAGQYVEWTLPHETPDTRGNRRYFTIASSPTEKVIRLGMGTNKQQSSFKKAMLAFGVSDTVSVGSLAGDFTMPKDAALPLVFIAGGVGITPFVSMVRDLLSKEEKRDITLFYAANTKEDFAYTDVFAQAEHSSGLKVVYVPGERITAEMIKKVPEYTKRLFYISGPQGMVEAYKTMLRELSIPRKNIKTDYFPGF